MFQEKRKYRAEDDKPSRSSHRQPNLVVSLAVTFLARDLVGTVYLFSSSCRIAAREAT